MRTTLVMVVSAGTILVSGCNRPPPYKPVADVKQVMRSVTDPAADVVWGSVGTIVTAQGTEERFPKTDEEWDAVLNGALAMTESGNLLMMGIRAKDTGDWMKLSQALIDVGVRTIKAAEAKDKDAIFLLGGEIYDVCTACHQTYAVDLAERTK